MAPRALPAGQSHTRPVSIYLGRVTNSPLSSRDLRAAAETHQELGPEYRDAVLDSFLERVGREIDARVDARLRQMPPSPPPAQRAPKNVNVMALALGSIALGIPISAIAASAGSHPAGIWGLLVVWIAIAAINLGYAARLRPPDHRDRG
jgi:hypothetical protein